MIQSFNAGAIRGKKLNMTLKDWDKINKMIHILHKCHYRELVYAANL